MIETSRRGFITGLISLVAAPAIVRAGSLMPVKMMPPERAIITEFYRNRVIRYYLDIQSIRDCNVLLCLDDAAGLPSPSFRGIPVRIIDGIPGAIAG